MHTHAPIYIYIYCWIGSVLQNQEAVGLPQDQMNTMELYEAAWPNVEY